MNIHGVILICLIVLFVSIGSSCSTSPYKATEHSIHNQKSVPVFVYTGTNDIALKPGELQYLGPVECKTRIYVHWIEGEKVRGHNIRVNCKGVTIIK